MALTPRDKLSLAITSAGSMRRLADLIGASHQQIGRWLREESPIPLQWNRPIDIGFKIHTQITRDQAIAQRLPFIKDAPVYMRKGIVRFGPDAGGITSRVITQHTQYLSDDLRREFLNRMFDTQTMYTAVIRSEIDAMLYAENRAAQEYQRHPSKKKAMPRLAQTIESEFRKKLNRERDQIIYKGEPLHLYTKKSIFLQTGKVRMTRKTAVESILGYLEDKHAPAAIALGDKMLFEIAPKHIKNDRTEIKSRTKTRKTTAKKSTRR